MNTKSQTIMGTVSSKLAALGDDKDFISGSEDPELTPFNKEVSLIVHLI